MKTKEKIYLGIEGIAEVLANLNKIQKDDIKRAINSNLAYYYDEVLFELIWKDQENGAKSLLQIEIEERENEIQRLGQTLSNLQKVSNSLIMLDHQALFDKENYRGL